MLCPHLGLTAPLVHAPEAPTLNGFGSISSEVISFEGSSGLGLLWAVTASQTFLVFVGLDSVEDWSGIL